MDNGQLGPTPPAPLQKRGVTKQARLIFQVYFAIY